MGSSSGGSYLLVGRFLRIVGGIIRPRIIVRLRCSHDSLKYYAVTSRDEN